MSSSSSPVSSLIGHIWTATTINNGKGAATGVIEGTQVTAAFSEDGRMFGSAGCNRFNAHYTVDGQSITITHPATTRMYCGKEGVMEQERVLLTMLPEAATFHIEGDRLQLRTAGGALIVSYAAGPTSDESDGEPDDAEAGSPLEGTRWVLTRFAGPEGAPAEATAAESSLLFEAGQVSGHGGCNRYGGSYTVDGDALTIGPLRATLMACEPARMAQEQAFMTGLQAATTYIIEGNMLYIRDASDVTTLTLTAVEPVSLVGTPWVATGINNGRQAVVSVVTGTTVTAHFGADGSLAGSAGCNQYRSTYRVDGATIVIQPPAGTRMLCPGEGVMEQESAYLSQLPRSATYRIEGERLELRSAEGALIASYKVDPSGT